MENLYKDVRKLMSDEYVRAAAKFGQFNSSDHESFAVILEELEESVVETNVCHQHINDFWNLTKDKNATDFDKKEVLKRLENSALLAACEFIQVATTAYKAHLSIMQREGE